VKSSNENIFIVTAIGGVLGLAIWLGVTLDRAQEKRVASPQVVEIEGCEYFHWETYYGYPVLTHKGNCKNHE